LFNLCAVVGTPLVDDTRNMADAHPFSLPVPAANIGAPEEREIQGSKRENNHYNRMGYPVANGRR
jgi:hypothetical protein